MKDKKIDSLDAIRGFAFIGVMLCHSGAIVFETLGWASVSLFLILSGFCFTISYYNKNRFDKISLTSCISFAKGKISKFFIVNIVCMFAMSLFHIVGNATLPLKRLLLLFFLNSLMIQTWVPLNNGSINGTSWYLCIYLFSCFLFPVVLDKLEQDNKKKVKINIIICLLFQLLFVIIAAYLPTKESIYEQLWESDLAKWLVYFFPLSRIFDFFLGCNIAVLYLKNDHSYSNKLYSIAEIASFLFLITVIVLTQLHNCHNVAYNGIGLIINYSWSYVLVYTLPSILLVYLFAINKGFLSKFLTCKFLLFFSKYSTYGFLIHWVVFSYIRTALDILIAKLHWDFLGDIYILLTIIIGIELTLLCVQIMDYIMKKLKSFF